MHSSAVASGQVQPNPMLTRAALGRDFEYIPDVNRQHRSMQLRGRMGPLVMDIAILIL